MMEDLIKRAKVMLILAYIIFFIVDSFYPLEVLQFSMVIIVVIIFLISFENISSFNKYVSLVLLSIGTFILIINQGSIADYSKGLVKNAGLISLLLSVSLLGIIFYFNNYQEFIVQATKKYMNSNYKFYTVTVFIISIIGMLLNIASLPLVYQLLEKASTNYPKQLFYKALTRGFTSSILWSPNFVSVAVVIQYLDVTWQQILPVGLLLALIANILGIIFEIVTNKPIYTSAIPNHNQYTNLPKEDKKIFLQLLTLLVLLIGFIILLEEVSGKSILVILPIVAFVFPLLMALLFRKLTILKVQLAQHLCNLSNKTDEFILFSAIGYFGYALGISNAGKYIPFLIDRLGLQSALTIIPLLTFTIVLLSLIGVHPIISIATIATVSANTLPISLIQMAAIFLMSYCIFHLISPFATVSLTMSNITGESQYNSNIKYNIYYAIFFVVVATLFLNILPI